jgi:hypothetical protein
LCKDAFDESLVDDGVFGGQQSRLRTEAVRLRIHFRFVLSCLCTRPGAFLGVLPIRRSLGVGNGLAEFIFFAVLTGRIGRWGIVVIPAVPGIPSGSGVVVASGGGHSFGGLVGFGGFNGCLFCCALGGASDGTI